MTRRWRVDQVFVLRHAGMPFDWLEDLAAPDDVLVAADRVIELADRLIAAAPRLAEHVRRGAIDGMPVPADRRTAELRDEWVAASAAYEAAYTAADEATSALLRSVLRHPDVEEAVFLSNPDVHRNMLVPYLEHTGSLTSRWRRVRRQLYTYVQRFCAKNETVSFYGPMAYGTAGRHTVLHRDRPRVRRVFISEWAARALIRAIARDTRILPELRFHRIDAAEDPVAAMIPSGGMGFRQLVRAVGRPAKEVALALRDLVGAGLVDVELGGGEYDLTPLQTLHTQLAALPPSRARAEWLDRIDELDTLRAAMTDQPLDKRIVGVAALEARFTEITGVPARRGAGATYADRAVFFEECASPFALEISAELFAEWERRLTPVLEACTAHGSATQAAAVDVVRDALAAAGHDPDQELDLQTYAARAAAALEAPTTQFHTAHAPTRPSTDPTRLVERAAALPGDRYAVIDLCAATDDERGLPGAELIVARTHHHLLVPSWLGTMLDDSQRFGAAARDWVRSRRGELVGFDFGRRNKGYYRFPGPEVAFRPLSWVDTLRDDLSPARDLSVTLQAGAACLRDASGRKVRAYLPLSDFVKYPPLAALAHPQVLHPAFGGVVGTELPRVMVGDVVVQRPRWDVPAADVAAPTPAGRFLRMRHLARLVGVRFVFCRSVHERKPYLIDLACPAAADLLAHIARDGQILGVEPMSPEPDRLWLRDAQGRRYTSEARIQVVGHEESR